MATLKAVEEIQSKLEQENFDLKLKLYESQKQITNELENKEDDVVTAVINNVDVTLTIDNQNLQNRISELGKFMNNRIDIPMI